MFNLPTIVYIIERWNKHQTLSHYVGFTRHLDTRMNAHFTGKVKSTKGYVLGKVIYHLVIKNEITEAIVKKYPSRKKKSLMQDVVEGWKIHEF
jgi:predicted GIY-YIG superfamily endonuclease